MKRFTRYSAVYCSYIIDGNESKVYSHQNVYGGDAVDRLAELEDKIENGTLIELPCKVGDKFYQVVKGLPICEWEVETIVFSNIYFPQNYVITARRSKDLAFWKFWSEDFGETIFLTREEAEKRLKELQE